MLLPDPFSITPCCALPVVVALILVSPLALALWLRSRYGGRWAVLALMSALLGGIAAARVAQVTYEPPAYNEEQVYPAEEWRKVHVTSELPTGLEYQQNEGVFVAMSQAEILITGIPPTCLVDGELAQRREYSSLPIEVTSNPRIQLPSPPNTPLYQITFDIPIQLDDTEILGVSSFAAYENGEVWCSERVVERGQGPGVALALAVSLGGLCRIIPAFFGGSAAMLVVAVAFLEIRHRRASVGR